MWSRLEEFYNRVAARSDVGYPAAIKHSQAVIQVLQEAISRGELRDVLRELPDEYEELISGQPRGLVSPSIPSGTCNPAAKRAGSHKRD